MSRRMSFQLQSSCQSLFNTGLSKTLKNHKIVILGEASVGKTCLTQRYVQAKEVK